MTRPEQDDPFTFWLAFLSNRSRSELNVIQSLWARAAESRPDAEREKWLALIELASVVPPGYRP